jgi:aquaporin related protein
VSDKAYVARMALVPCIAISTGYILLVLFLCELARKVIAPLNPGLVKTALNEAIAAADLCGCCFELIIIADNYGLAAYGLYLFLLTIWWSMKWGDATACPYNHFEECVQGNMSRQETAVRTVAQTLGGIAVFRVIQLLWSLEIAETHVGRSHSAVYNVCSADLTVPVLHGAIIEGVATLICRLGSRLVALKEPQYATAVDSFIATSMVCAAFSTSGGYLNPVLATSLKFGCRGHTPMEHFVVYWVGSSLGAIASLSVWPHVEEAISVKQA